MSKENIKCAGERVHSQGIWRYILSDRSKILWMVILNLDRKMQIRQGADKALSIGSRMEYLKLMYAVTSAFFFARN